MTAAVVHFVEQHADCLLRSCASCSHFSSFRRCVSSVCVRCGFTIHAEPVRCPGTFLEADPHEPFAISAESKDLAWVELGRVTSLNPEESMARMVRKTVRVAPTPDR